MNTEQIRKEFEDWAMSRRFAVDRDPYLVGNPYTSVWTTGAWEAWQAALATQPQAPQGAVTDAEVHAACIAVYGNGSKKFNPVYLQAVRSALEAFTANRVAAAPKTETPEGEKQ